MNCIGYYRSEKRFFVPEQKCFYQDIDDIDRDGLHVFEEDDGKIYMALFGIFCLPFVKNLREPFNTIKKELSIDGSFFGFMGLCKIHNYFMFDFTRLLTLFTCSLKQNMV